jgi:glutathione peroxidase-family protein
MKFLFTFAFILSGFLYTYGQGGNEQSPIVEKEIAYRDWSYKSVQTGADLNLRKITSGKKLVMVVYFAPWCPNWKHDLQFVQAMYDKYKGNGFDVVGVAEYDPVDSMKSHIAQYKLTFPIVWESDARTAKQTTPHYGYRRFVGDSRNWGSPWYIFLETNKLETDGAAMTKKAPVVNGELIKPDVEKFIREKIGIAPMSLANAVSSTNEIEVCDPAKTPVAASSKVASKP